MTFPEASVGIKSVMSYADTERDLQEQDMTCAEHSCLERSFSR